MQNKDDIDYTLARSPKGSGMIMSALGLSGIPHAIVVDKEGNIAFSGHPADSGFESTVAEVSRDPVNLGALDDDDIASLPIKFVKAVLKLHSVDLTGVVEKAELIALFKDLA